MKKNAPSPKLNWEEVAVLWGGMVFAQRSLHPVTRKITEQYSLGPRGAWIIQLIASGHVFPSDITPHFRVGNSLISAELSRLTEAGLITYTQGAKDRRRIRLSLTPAGKQAVRRLRAGVSKLMHQRFSHYSREEILLCSRMLQDFIGEGGALKASRLDGKK
jgi:DNA-binding MarR family transcriptional regulator